MKASPLENYSSLHEWSLIELLRWNIPWLRKPFFVQFNFNLHTPLKVRPETYITFHTRNDDDLSPDAPNCSFSISNITRWGLDIYQYQSLDDFLNRTIRWHRCNYKKSKKKFLDYGCETTFIEGDWSEYAEQAFQLYLKVAQKFDYWLYDLNFFQEIAKRPDYKLLCAWFKGEMVAVFVLQEELPTLHFLCCGLDYQHSTNSYAYTWMNYALFEYAIPRKKYKHLDAGLSADESKKAIGYQPIPSRMDIYSKGLVHHVLRGISRFFKASITPNANVKLEWRR